MHLYLKALRPHQWIKNSLVFVPMVTAHQYVWATYIDSLLAFCAFSFVASSAYVINDVVDIKSDRAHIRKRHRPIASGKLPVGRGKWMATALLLGSISVATLVGTSFVVVLLFYFLITSAYSFWLKRIVIVDIFVLAGLYTTRVLSGGVATGIDVSSWLLAFSVFFFLSLAVIKRLAELIDQMPVANDSLNGRGYITVDKSFISQMAFCSGLISVLVMALYINTPEISLLYKSPSALWGYA